MQCYDLPTLCNSGIVGRPQRVLLIQKKKIITASLKNSTDTSAASARFSNYDQIMLLNCFQSRATIPKMKDHIIVSIVSLLILSASVKANKGENEEEMLRR